MGVLIFVGVVCFMVAAGFVGAFAVINTGKPRLSAHQIEAVLHKYHDDHGEFDYRGCANEIEERLQP